MNLRNRRRLQAGLIVAVFVVPVIVMLGLALAGWAPHGRSYGQRIQPELVLANVPRLPAGSCSGGAAVSACHCCGTRPRLTEP